MPYDCDVDNIIVQSNVILCCCITFDFRRTREGCKSHLLPIREAIGAICDFNELVRASLGKTLPP